MYDCIFVGNRKGDTGSTLKILHDVALRVNNFVFLSSSRVLLMWLLLCVCHVLCVCVCVFLCVCVCVCMIFSSFCLSFLFINLHSYILLFRCNFLFFSVWSVMLARC